MPIALRFLQVRVENRATSLVGMLRRADRILRPARRCISHGRAFIDGSSSLVARVPGQYMYVLDTTLSQYHPIEVRMFHALVGPG